MPSLAIVGLIVEDRAFADFLVPAVRRLAEACGVCVETRRPIVVSGCRPQVLEDACHRELPAVRILVLGADASAPGGRGIASHRRKAQGLLRISGLAKGSASAATAAPSVEAWLLSDPQALKRGLEAGTGLPFRMPPAWPRPRTEREAKRELARIVTHGLGGPQPRSGFEHAREIVSRMELLDSTDDSLRDWARDFAARLGTFGGT